MKYQIFLFIVFIFYIKANAQIIAIPDANFKYKLTHGYPNWNYGYDTSHDGEIDMQEAAAITSLTMSRQNIHDITGVRSFVNLQTLNVANCGIYTFDLHDMVSLKTFNCEYNYNLTTSIDLSGCSNLTAIRCGANPITNINLTGAYSLQTFKADYHALTQIDFTGLTQLKTISINYGNLESINLTDVPNLQTLYAFQNRITSLYLSDRPNLRSVLCDSNRLVNMDLKNNPSLINV